MDLKLVLVCVISLFIGAMVVHLNRSQTTAHRLPSRGVTVVVVFVLGVTIFAHWQL